MEAKDIYKELIQSLKLIASSYQVQVSSLPDYVCVADEIALIYNEAYIMLPQINNRISPLAVNMLDELNKRLEEMSMDKSLWNNKSLEENVHWEKVRKLGHLILGELKEEYTRPNLDFIYWVK